MTYKEITESLCLCDTRNPDCTILDHLDEDDPEYSQYGPHRQEKCSCDNCSYGRTPLAETLLEVVGAHASLIIRNPANRQRAQERRLAPKLGPSTPGG